jgi:hypothetical protein
MELPISTGRKVDVLIRDYYVQNPLNGELLITEVIEVFADAGMKAVIEKVPGVMLVGHPLAPIKYEVVLDPRYNREIVKKEIMAAILCAPAAEPKERS